MRKKKPSLMPVLMPIVLTALVLFCVIKLVDRVEDHPPMEETSQSATSPPRHETTDPSAPTTTAPEESETTEPQTEVDILVDQVLDTIITEDMTVRQQVQAIYRWARAYLGYGGHMEPSDYVQAGCEMLRTGRGDCYGYFAATKLMFERLGIPNIDVCKVKNFDGDSNHFWSLVSVDGGKTYYHFDATPRVGDGDDFCLVTDTFLDAYSDSHKGSHNRDRSLYPATPEA